MMESIQSPLYEVIWRTRRLFQQLRTAGDALHEQSGITASQRAVLEFLSQHQPQTVPQIAHARSVSRQHIQNIVNELLERGLVDSLENPSHKRSSLLRMTRTGNRLFGVIRRREEKLLEVMEKKFNKKDLRTTAQTLQVIEEYLQANQWRELTSLPNKGENP